MKDDLISRRAAINAMCDACDAVTAACPHYPCKRYLAIESLQSGERKKGRWIYGEDGGQDGWYCSECNGFVPWDYEYYGLENIDFIDDFKVCPFCEADMISRTGADITERKEG